jgi:hypothetical protein
MKTLVYLGPTLSHEEAKKIYPEATYLPPIECGDLIKAMEAKPERIAIIDGYFHYRAAVWHKEILYALSQGVEVYGSSSMGALRAAELYKFGMQGVGEVFNNFKTGALQDDDEVAVLHASKRSGFTPKTDAMINIRATLSHAIRNNVLSDGACNIILSQLKDTFYQDRILNKAIKLYCDNNSVNQDLVVSWLEENYIDVKKDDAKKLLQLLSLCRKKTIGALFEFHSTCFFKELLTTTA